LHAPVGCRKTPFFQEETYSVPRPWVDRETGRLSAGALPADVQVSPPSVVTSTPGCPRRRRSPFGPGRPRSPRDLPSWLQHGAPRRSAVEVIAIVPCPFPSVQALHCREQDLRVRRSIVRAWTKLPERPERAPRPPPSTDLLTWPPAMQRQHRRRCCRWGSTTSEETFPSRGHPRLGTQVGRNPASPGVDALEHPPRRPRRDQGPLRIDRNASMRGRAGSPPVRSARRPCSEHAPPGDVDVRRALGIDDDRRGQDPGSGPYGTLQRPIFCTLAAGRGDDESAERAAPTRTPSPPAYVAAPAARAATTTRAAFRRRRRRVRCRASSISASSSATRSSRLRSSASARRGGATTLTRANSPSLRYYD
jgi:hypothetical protein